jgi:U3 small nucleolar RNA-associated protein 12
LFALRAQDATSDGTLLVTGGADKNVKVWGLEFGDCHRSLFAYVAPLATSR